MSDDVTIRFGAESSALKSGSQEASGAVESSTQAMTDAFNRAADQVDSASRRAADSLKNRGGLVPAVEDAKKGMDLASESTRKLTGLLGGLATAAAAKSVLDTAVAMDSMNRAFKAIVGSSEGAAAEMAFLRYESERLGLEFVSVAQTYKGISAAAQGTVLAGQGVRDIFIGISEKATVLGLSAQDVSLVLYAVQQMMSKGVVSMEELRRQMGERLPGAMQLLATAMDMTVMELTKMIETGGLASDEALPKLAASLHESSKGSVGEAAKSAQASINRLTNTITDLKLALLDSSNMNAFQDALKGAEYVVKTFATGVLTLMMALRSLGMQMAAVAASANVLAGAFDFSQAKSSVGDFFSGLHDVLSTDVGASIDPGVAKMKSGLGSFTVLNKGAADQIKSIWDGLGKDLSKTEEDYLASVERLWSKPKPPPAPVPAPGSADFVGPPVTSPDADKYVKKLKDQLKSEEDAYILSGRMKDWTHQKEVDFWRDQLATVSGGTEAYKAIQHEMASAMEKVEKDKERTAKKGSSDAKKAAAEARREAKESYDNEIADFRLQLEQQRKNGEEKIRIAQQMAERARKEYGEDSKQYKDMLRVVEQAERTHIQEMRKLKEAELDLTRDHLNALTDLEEENVRFRKEMGIITEKQSLVELQAVEQKRYEIEKNALIQRRGLQGLEVEDRRRINADLERLEDKHRLQVVRINHQMALETQRRWQAVAQAVTSGFSTALKGLITRTMTWKQALGSVLDSVLNVFIQMAEQMVTKWIMTHVVMKAISTVFETEEQATKAATAAAGLAISKAVGVSEVTTNAAVGATAAGASVAAIPVIGWAMAPGVTAETFAMLMAFAPIAAAAQGYDIPAGVNPMVQAHQEEMILPADIANPLRSMVKGGGGRDGAIHFYINAVDSKSFAQQLKRSDSALNKQIKKSFREFRLRPARA